MNFEKLTLEGIRARPVVVRLARPIVNRTVAIEDWPLILIDLYTQEGVIGRSYLEPYLVKAMRYLIPALNDLGDLLKGRAIAPVELFDAARESLRSVGYEGQSLIAVSGLDMAAWDALARAANVPLCVLLGGSVGSVKAYNSNGLWLKEPGAVADEAVALLNEGGFEALKLRLGRARSDDDLAAIEAVQAAVGDQIKLMIDYSQALDLSEALQRCHMIDDLGLAWIEEPIVYDNLDGCARLTAELKTPLQMGENFYGPRDLHKAIQQKACDLVMPRLHADRWGDGLDAVGSHRGRGRHSRLDASLSRGRRAHDARNGNRALAGMAELERADPSAALRDQKRTLGDSRHTGVWPRMGRGLRRCPFGRFLEGDSSTALCPIWAVCMVWRYNAAW